MNRLCIELLRHLVGCTTSWRGGIVKQIVATMGNWSLQGQDMLKICTGKRRTGMEDKTTMNFRPVMAIFNPFCFYVELFWKTICRSLPFRGCVTSYAKAVDRSMSEYTKLLTPNILRTPHLSPTVHQLVDQPRLGPGASAPCSRTMTAWWKVAHRSPPRPDSVKRF